MSVRPYRDIIRRKTRTVTVGPIEVGSDAPITVQSMTNTDTSDAGATIAQIKALEEAGVDIVRVFVPTRHQPRRSRPSSILSVCQSSQTFTFTISAVWKQPMQARPVCGSIPETSGQKTACAK